VVKLNYDLVTAGQVFAASQVVAMFARVFWGWLGSKLNGMALLGLLGVSMALIAVVMGLVTPAWPFAAVIAVALALAGTAVSWHGINLSEIARLSPAGMVGAVTGGIIAFGSVSGILFPVGMTALLAATGSYALCFWIAAAAPLVVGILLLRHAAPQKPQSGPA
jgi:nitrate/nitrite transporter NarK